ncbi:MAG: TolC family protein [Candidatus Omnitrophica bacterium]|jgi:outer membrane protein TolC/DNA-binding XRE family transcriptional regulator|nr:TolC family protein [Candidatus Omnitrophota bacterium]
MISANIRKLRSRTGISQDRLSKLSDLSLNTIVKVESGANPNPTIKTLVKIAKVFDVKVDDLLKAVIFATFCACWFGSVWAGPQQPKEKVITLSEGIKIVLSDNRLIKISLLDNEISYEDSLLSRSVLLPQVSLDASRSFLRFQPASRLNSQIVNTAQKDSYSYGFNVYQTLFDFGKNLSSYMASREKTKAQEARTESVKRVAVLEFIASYFDLLEAEKMIAVFEDEVKSLVSYLNDIEHLYQQGVVVENDVLPAKVRLADVKQKLISSRNSRQLAVARLNNILSFPLRQAIIVRDIPGYPVSFPEMDRAWDMAKTNRPEVIFYNQQMQASISAERSKAAGNLPVIFAQAGYAYQQNQYQAHQDNFSTVLGAKMDLYDGGLARAQLLKERLHRQQLGQQKEKLLEDIRFEIEESYYGLENARETMLVAKDALAQAEENVRFYRAKYEAGSANPTEVLEAITQETTAQANYYNSDYQLKRGYAKYLYSMGIDLSLVYERMEK